MSEYLYILAAVQRRFPPLSSLSPAFKLQNMSNDLFSLYPQTQSLSSVQIPSGVPYGLAWLTLLIYSKEDMQELLNDPAYFSAFFDSLQSVQARDEQLEASLARNQQATGELAVKPSNIRLVPANTRRKITI